MKPSVAVLTAEGRGAIAVVRVWGEGALAVVDSAFRPARGSGLAGSKVGRLRLGRLGAGLGDEVVSVVVGDDPLEVEIQCHGGPSAVDLVVSALVSGGARLQSARAWVRRSAGSRLRAEAAFGLARCSTLRTAEILVDQFEGALDRDLEQALAANPSEAVAILEALRVRGRVGVRLVEGWRVVLAGRPNVGKSRLLNALAGYDRAIVDPTPGTTRDVVTVAAAFDGWPVELADTAGLRDSTDPIETLGVARARDHQRRADLVLVVLDRSEPLIGLDHAVLDDHPDGLVVANKSDLPAAWDDSSIPALNVSAERGDGLDSLVEAIAGRLVPEPPEPGSGVPFRPVQARRIGLILERLNQGDWPRARKSLERWLT